MYFMISVAVTHGCIIATLTLFSPDGSEACRVPTSVVGSNHCAYPKSCRASAFHFPCREGLDDTGYRELHSEN